MTAYIERAYKKYCNPNTKACHSPIANSSTAANAFMAMQLAESGKPSYECDYLGLMGTLLFVSMTARPDIAYHTSFMGQFMSAYNREHYEAALVVLAYLHHTRHLGLTYRAEPAVPSMASDPALSAEQFRQEHGLHAASDASFGSVRSHGGHAVCWGGAAVCWASRKLRVIAQSTPEAEMCAGVAAAKDIIFVRYLLTFMGMKPTGPTPLLIDNDAMWKNIRNAVLSKRTRYWELWTGFVRSCYERLVLTVHLIKTDDEFADLFTKAFKAHGADFEKLKRMRGTLLGCSTP